MSSHSPRPPTSGPPSAGPPPPPGASAAGSALADREQKSLDTATEVLHQRVSEIKSSIASLIAKLETDPRLNWPSFLDSYALISGQINSLLKVLKNEKTPYFKKYICLPLALSPDRDEELTKLTEGRISTFSHDLVPDYLRTKPDPDVEQRHMAFENRAANLLADSSQKQLTAMEKIINVALKNISREKEEMESKANLRAEIEKTSSIEDTYSLVAAISNGKGLKLNMGPMGPGGPGPKPMGMPGVPGPNFGPQPPQMAPNISKAPSTIKTNIKSATQVHPYAR